MGPSWHSIENALIIYLHNLFNLRGGLGTGTILAGAGGSSVINSLQAYPDLIKKYQVKLLHRYHTTSFTTR